MTATPLNTPAPIVRSVDVPVPPARAFELFTTRMDDWWPLATHSVFELEAAGVRIAPEVGGQIVERSRTGATSVWGTVLTWEPGVEVAFTWHPGNEPGRATRVSVRFEPASGGSRVVLVHDEWEGRLDDLAPYPEYEAGWARVLDGYRSVTLAA